MGLAAKEETTAAIRIPENIASAKNDDERWELRTAEWLERINLALIPLKKDRPEPLLRGEEGKLAYVLLPNAPMENGDLNSQIGR